MLARHTSQMDHLPSFRAIVGNQNEGCTMGDRLIRQAYDELAYLRQCPPRGRTTSSKWHCHVDKPSTFPAIQAA